MSDVASAIQSQGSLVISDPSCRDLRDVQVTALRNGLERLSRLQVGLVEAYMIIPLIHNQPALSTRSETLEKARMLGEAEHGAIQQDSAHFDKLLNRQLQESRAQMQGIIVVQNILNPEKQDIHIDGMICYSAQKCKHTDGGSGKKFPIPPTCGHARRHLQSKGHADYPELWIRCPETHTYTQSKQHWEWLKVKDKVNVQDIGYIDLLKPRRECIIALIYNEEKREESLELLGLCI